MVECVGEVVDCVLVEFEFWVYDEFVIVDVLVVVEYDCVCVGFEVCDCGVDVLYVVW